MKRVVVVALVASVVIASAALASAVSLDRSGQAACKGLFRGEALAQNPSDGSTIRAAEQVLLDPTSPYESRMRARLIVGLFNETLSTEEIARLLAAHGVGESSFAGTTLRQQLMRRGSAAERVAQVDKVLQDLREIQRAERRPVTTPLDDVFVVAVNGQFTDGIGVTPAERQQVLTRPRGVPQSADAAPQLRQLLMEIDAQVAGSPLFFGFAELTVVDGVRLMVQNLMIKPYSEWSPRAKAYFAFHHPEQTSRISLLSGRWIQASFMDLGERSNSVGHRVRLKVANSLTFKGIGPEGHPISPIRLAEILDRASDPGEFMPVLAAHRLTVLENQELLPATNSSGERGLFLPAEVIDWERSFIQAAVTRPTATPGLEHTVRMLTTMGGREVFMIDGSSGSLRDAAALSRSLRGLPTDWNRIPSQYRTLPRTLEEMRQQLEWMASARFGRP